MSKQRKPEARRHHYVPRCLLKNFSVENSGDTPQVFVFDKFYSKAFKTSTNNICLERDFYNVNFAGKQASAEFIFTKAEDRAAPVIQILLRDRNISVLNCNQRESLIAFIALQQTRSVGSRARYYHWAGPFKHAFQTKIFVRRSRAASMKRNFRRCG